MKNDKNFYESMYTCLVLLRKLLYIDMLPSIDYIDTSDIQI